MKLIEKLKRKIIMNWWQYLMLVNIYLLLFYGFMPVA